MFKIGDKVKGRYDTYYYEGIITQINGGLITVKQTISMDGDFKVKPVKGWLCVKRSNGVWACAAGCDDGKHNLQLIESKLIKFYNDLGIQK